MIRFLGTVVFIFLPLIIASLIIGRRMEESEERVSRDLKIREGMKALGGRVRNLEKIRSDRKERRGE